MALKKTFLNNFNTIANNLKTYKKNQIATLHKIIFENEGDRKNRQRLREFEGFRFKKDDHEYIAKYDYIQQKISQPELMSTCMLLGLDCNLVDLKTTILKNLGAEYFLEDLSEDDDDDEEDEAEESEGEMNDDEQQSIVNDVRNIINIDEDEYLSNDGRRHNARMTQQRFALSLRDVEETMKPFDGKNNMGINEWTQEFEETADLYGWDEMQLLVFAKNSLTGLAKQFVNTERGLTTWPKLKRAQLIEFRDRTDSRQIHRMLTEKIMKKGESVMEYLYTMKDIAAKGNVTKKDLIL